ncbi:MAG: hypothetical protein SNI51_06210 [Rikenellaceae bacterium]
MDPDVFKSSYVDVDIDAIDQYDITDYGVISDYENDQTSLIQAAVTDVSSKGGGALNIPAGDYRLAGVSMASNVHIIVDQGVTFYPAWDEEYKIVMFIFGGSNGLPGKYNENCSIRCAQEGEQYKVDLEMTDPQSTWKYRFATAGYVKNFKIDGANITDLYSIYCSINISATGSNGVDGWDIQHAEDGEITNITLSKAHPGYGLVQMHSARRMWVENVSCEGGITLRLETGATNAQGVHDIYGYNLYNYNGRAALMMGPHMAQNGIVLADGLYAESSTFALQMGAGFDDEKDDDDDSEEEDLDESALTGSFADGCRIINIHAVYGEDTQLKARSMHVIDPYLYDKIRYEAYTQNNVSTSNYKWLRGPSCAAVQDGLTVDGVIKYTVDYEGIVTEGFMFNRQGVLYTDDEDVAYREENISDCIATWESLYLYLYQ